MCKFKMITVNGYKGGLIAYCIYLIHESEAVVI